MSQRKLASPLSLLLLIGGLALPPATSGAPRFPSIGPIFDEFELTLTPGKRREAIGPLFFYEEVGPQRQWSFPPVLSYTVDRPLEMVEFDFLYPLLTYDRFGREYRFQIFQFFSFAGGQTQDFEINRRFTLFPIIFHQSSPHPELNYTAVVPVYGTIKNRLLRDEIRFVLFPLYSQSRRRDFVTDNYLYPVFHFRRGDHLRGWQVWPLVGRETRDSFTRTNRFGDLEFVPGHDNLFVLWPLYFDNRAGIDTDAERRTLAFLPLFSTFRSPTRHSMTAPWPIGFTYTNDREAEFREFGVPWPLIVFARGPGKHTTRIWPLYSQARTETLESNFYLWPLYSYRRIDSHPLERERRRILFFLYSDILETTREGPEYRRRTDLWPLFTRRVDMYGNERLQILAPLEPFLPENKSIERNYSPLWSLWRDERNPEKGVSSQSFLWNLYRREVAPERRKISLLFGLFQYQSDPAGTRWRVFYIPAGGAGREVAQ
jgi:hypothetical protein